MSRAGEPGRSSRRPPTPAPVARDCLEAVSHPDRRRVLRVLHGAEEPRSPSEISEALGVTLSGVSHHVRTLRQFGMVALTDTRPRQGSTERFYVSTVAGSALIGAILEATRAEDEDKGATDR